MPSLLSYLGLTSEPEQSDELLHSSQQGRSARARPPTRGHLPREQRPRSTHRVQRTGTTDPNSRTARARQAGRLGPRSPRDRFDSHTTHFPNPETYETGEFDDRVSAAPRTRSPSGARGPSGA